MITAGPGTTAATLTTAFHYLTAQPQLWRKLQAGLLSTFPDPAYRPQIVELEQIPLLEAVCKESLRLTIPIRGRHPRVVPTGGWEYAGHHLPVGVRCVGGLELCSC
jgi:cytochrome P450